MERREGRESTNPVERLPKGERTRVRNLGIVDADDAKESWTELYLAMEKGVISPTKFEALTGMEVDYAGRKIRDDPRFSDWFEKERTGRDGKEFEAEFKVMLKATGVKFEDKSDSHDSHIDFETTDPFEPGEPTLGRFELKRVLEFVRAGKRTTEKGRAQISKKYAKDDPPTYYIFKLCHADGRNVLKYADAATVRASLRGESTTDSVGAEVGKLEWSQMMDLPDFDGDVLRRLVVRG